jgi:hypothetical protein
VEHADLDRAIHETHKQSQQLYGLFTQSRNWLVRAIQFDEDWYPRWVKDHPAPGPLAE